MRILYGVQATGNGHITRARTMARELEKSRIEVDYAFSGRPREKLFNMEPFSDYRCFRGLTFVTEKGRINRLKTMANNNLLQFARDVTSLDLTAYDLVITDFEPVTAWAARIKGVPSIGLGHQYAFNYGIPMAGDDPFSRLIMKMFAPARRSLGVHWHHFNSPILPPLIEPADKCAPRMFNKILVYLAFNDTNDIVDWLAPIKEYEFYIYCQTEQPEDKNNLHLRPFSRREFLDDLADCSGVITNAGFELASEAIQCGKKLLVIPLKGQMEQTSNALALTQLGYGDAMGEFGREELNLWLAKPNPPPRPYPNVAQAVVEWLESGMTEDELSLSKALWNRYLTSPPV